MPEPTDPQGRRPPYDLTPEEMEAYGLADMDPVDDDVLDEEELARYGLTGRRREPDPVPPDPVRAPAPTASDPVRAPAPAPAPSDPVAAAAPSAPGPARPEPGRGEPGPSEPGRPVPEERPAAVAPEERPAVPAAPDLAAVAAPDLGVPDLGAPDLGAPDLGAPDLAAPVVVAAAAERSGAVRTARPTDRAPVPDEDPRDPPHRRRARIARLPVLATVAVLLLVGIVAGGAGSGPGRAAAPALGGPVAAPAAALSSSWFCAGATDSRHGPAPAQLVITNAGPASVDATVTLVPSAGRSRVERVSVGPDARRSLAETVAGGAPWIGSIVDLDAGAATVEQQITGPLGTTATPCATSGSTSWYFPAGATLVNATSTITLLNPYPSPAIVNLDFTTNEGVEQPGAFQAVAVPAGGLVAVDLGTHLRRRTQIATSVGASAGRVVAWQTNVVSAPPRGTPYLGSRAASRAGADPASPFLGVTALLGAPATATSWAWPEGGASAGVSEQYTIYNPGAATARVALAVDLDQGSAEPFDLTIGPEETTTVTTGAETRIPEGTGFSAVLRSTNGVGVVAERTVSAARVRGEHGIAAMLGSTAGARSWLVGAGGVSRATDEVVSVANMTTGPVTVGLRALTGGTASSVPGADTVRLAGLGQPGASRMVWDLGRLDPSLDGPVLVTASGAVVVARDLIGRGDATGVSFSLGVPLSG